MVAISSGTASLNIMWRYLFHGADDSEHNDNLTMDCTFVRDNAKSHQRPNRSSALVPQMPVYRRSLKARLDGRASDRSPSGVKICNSRDNRSLTRFQSFPVSKSTRDDHEINIKTSALARCHQVLRRSASSDHCGDIAADRWLVGGRSSRGITLGKILSSHEDIVSCSSDDDDDDDDEDDEPPPYACCNAQKPARQASEDQEVVRRMVENMQQEGIIPK